MTAFSQYFLLAFLAAAFVMSYFIFEPFLGALVMAAVFAVILQPVYLRILRAMPRWPSVASLLTVLVSVIFVLVPIGTLGTQIGFEAANLYTDLTDGDTRAELVRAVAEIESQVTRYVPQAAGFSESLAGNISNYAQVALGWIVQHLGSAFAGIASIALSLFVFFVALYYLLRDGEHVKAMIVVLSPLNDRHDEAVFDRLERAVNSVIKGSLAIALIQGIISGVGYAIFGVPNAALWGTVTAIAALIPGVGTALVITPMVAYLFLAGNAAAALGLLAWGAVAVGLVDNLLGPRLIGSGIKLHPLIVLLSVLGGISFFGAMGIFLGPLVVSLLFALLTIYRDLMRGGAV